MEQQRHIAAHAHRTVSRRIESRWDESSHSRWPAKPVLASEIPSDLESRIQELLDSVTDPEQFEKSVLENNPFIRDAEITVIESKPPGTGGMF